MKDANPDSEEIKRPKLPDKGLGKFMIAAGLALVILPLPFPQIHLDQKFFAAAAGFSGYSWGLRQVTAAKKWKQKYGEPTPAERMEVKKSHSISGLPILLAFLLIAIGVLMLLGMLFVTFFHYQGVRLKHP